MLRLGWMQKRNRISCRSKISMGFGLRTIQNHLSPILIFKSRKASSMGFVEQQGLANPAYSNLYYTSFQNTKVSSKSTEQLATASRSLLFFLKPSNKIFYLVAPSILIGITKQLKRAVQTGISIFLNSEMRRKWEKKE